MAFCRWSSSDLYVYPEDGYGEQEGQGVMTCCCCPAPVGDGWANYSASTPRAFYDHLEAHERAGHVVSGGYRALIQAIDAEAHLWFGVGH